MTYGNTVPSADEPVAVDEIATVQYQGIKLIDATEGSTTPVGTTASPLIVRAAPSPRGTQFALVTQAAAFGVNDQLCDELELTSMALVAGGGGVLNNLVLFSNNLTAIWAQLWLYQVNPTAAGANSVHDQSDANNAASTPLAVIDFNSWNATASNMQTGGAWMGLPLSAGPGIAYQCLDGTATTSLFGIVMTRTGVTPGATGDYYLGVWRTPGV